MLLHGWTPSSAADSNRAASRAVRIASVSAHFTRFARTNYGSLSPREGRSPVFLTLRSSGRYSRSTTVLHSTTILAVRHRGRAVLAGDGQVTFGQTIVKQSAKKIRRLYNDRILA